MATDGNGLPRTDPHGRLRPTSRDPTTPPQRKPIVATRTFTRAELEDLEIPGECIHTEVVGQWRHGTRNIGVFEADGKHWRIQYLDNPGDDEPCDSWDYADKAKRPRSISRP